MSSNDFNPSSEAKLAGGDDNLIPVTAPVSMGSLDMGDQLGNRLPLSPRPPKGEARPEAALIDAPQLLRSVPAAEEAMLRLARQSFDSSTTYFGASHRNRVVDAMARFNSEHPKGSKYWSNAFERRSRLFRPKTRSTVRKREAATAVSLFGSSDIVNVKAVDGSAASTLDASIQEELLNYRMQQDKRWYMFVLGGVQDAERQGFAIAKTFWDYEESDRYYDELHPELGAIKRVDTVASKDRPGYSLVPIERFHFSPAADWMDVVGSSPYIIEEIPMYVCDVRRYAANPNARLKYRNLSLGELLGGRSDEWSEIRTQRERNAQNRYDRLSESGDYAIVWVHRNILRIDGEDYIFDSVGTVTMLSNIIPLSEFDPRGYRGYVVGSTLFESHNPFNVGGVTLMGPMQDEINDSANLRVDANKMATSGRMFIKRNSGVDLHALARFSPGAAVELDNPDKDVKWDRSPEAPRGMFEENQLLNTEVDDLMGNFSQGSVSANRNLNETVGGMQMLGDSANQMTEYDLHTFCVTFVTEVLHQVLDLEKQWETDIDLASIIGKRKAVTARQFWTALGTESKVTVNVGFGATNPAKRVERMGMAFSTMAQYMPGMMAQADQGEMTKDLFAAVGISDVGRYFPFIDDPKNAQQDPKVKALQQQLAIAQAQAEPVQAKIQGDLQKADKLGQIQLQVAKLRAESNERVATASNEAALKLKIMELRLAFVELKLESEKNDIARSELMLEREKLSNDITMQRLEFGLEQATAMASIAPPNVQVPADAQREASALATPGSNLPASNFDKTFANAGDYVKRTEQGT